MRKTYILFILVLIMGLALSASGQEIRMLSFLEKGSLTYSFQLEQERSRWNDINLRPSLSIGYMVKNNLMLNFNYSYGQFILRQNSRNIRLGLFPSNQELEIGLRKYTHLGKGFLFYMEGGLLGGYSRQGRDPQTGEVVVGGPRIGLYALSGIQKQFNDQWSLQLGMNMQTSYLPLTSRVDVFRRPQNTMASYGIHFGINYHFKKKLKFK